MFKLINGIRRKWGIHFLKEDSFKPTSTLENGRVTEIGQSVHAILREVSSDTESSFRNSSKGNGVKRLS